MNRYNLYCTPEQTKKAIELGAPIEYKYLNPRVISCTINNCEFSIPTAEQMIGWLEEQGLVIDIVNNKNACHWSVWLRENSQVELVLINDSINNYCTTYKEAIINSITAALDYLRDK